jgi:hypothetical protein
MSGEMVERVARAIAYSETADPEMWSAFVEVARAAIAAMREPTEAMLQAASNAPREPFAPTEPRDTWQAIIDEALK